jgi:mitogen-activated protein kinase kinase kinase 11
MWQGLFLTADYGCILCFQGAVLRRARDVAAGLAHLHSQNICHGDLKCENVLLRSDASDPERVTAKVADFGLSRALAVGQSHLSTRRYGTVTHMPPELLSSGKLTVAADVYSFGIMCEYHVLCASTIG